MDYLACITKAPKIWATKSGDPSNKTLGYKRHVLDSCMIDLVGTFDLIVGRVDLL